MSIAQDIIYRSRVNKLRDISFGLAETQIKLSNLVNEVKKAEEKMR